MNLNSCLNSWTDHINILVLKGSKYQGQAINGFKEGTRTKNAHDFIVEHLSSNSKQFVLDTTNLEATIYYLLTKCDPTLYSIVTYQFLVNCINTKRMLSTVLNDDQLAKLKECQNKAKSTFDELEIDEPFISQLQQPESTPSSTPTQNIINETLQPTNYMGNSYFDLSVLKNMLDEKFNKINQQLLNLSSIKSGYDIQSFNQLLNTLGYRIKKLLLAEHGLKIQDHHSEPTNNTCPAQLSINNFFQPYSFSSKFLTKMDTIHNTAIDSIIDAVKEELNDRIIALKEDIEKIKVSLERFKTKDEIKKLVEDQMSIEEEKLKKRFTLTLNKAKKSKRESFLIYYKDQINDKLFDDYKSDNNSINSFNTNNSTIRSSRAKSKSKNSSRTSSKNFRKNERNSNFNSNQEQKTKYTNNNNIKSNYYSNNKRNNNNLNSQTNPRK